MLSRPVIPRVALVLMTIRREDIRPSLDEFIALAAEYSVVPVTCEVLADRETPVSCFETLCGDGPAFLLESVEGGENWARWSFVGWDPLFVVRSHDGRVNVEQEEGETPLDVLNRLATSHTTPKLPGLPPLHSGLVGYLAFDAIRYIEVLPNRPSDDRGLPEMLWQFVGSLAAFDRFRQSIILIRNVLVGDKPTEQYEEAVLRLLEAGSRLGRTREYSPSPIDQSVQDPPFTSTFERSEFEAAVRRCKEYILGGDAFQIVLSQRLATPYVGDPFLVYRALRLINPSPFLFFVRDEEVTLAGASPELMTRVRDGVAYSRPIAGTRKRGVSEEEDRRLEAELLADPKERAEHVMLIDLARNDLGRVCEFGTVRVDDLMVIERYSHVMHIVSGVSGKVRDGRTGVDVIKATFPHGTVSGAPKVRAIEIIDEIEPVARGPYAGMVGYLDFSGNVDTCIGLRTVVFGQEMAWVQAGAGLVADSDPALEYEETMNKAAAALKAISRSQYL